MIEFKDPSILKALEKAVSDTFEGIAFAQILETKLIQTPVARKEGAYCSFIELTAPVKLRLFMLMSHDHLIECFSGVYPDMDLEKVPQEVYDDFVNELTNTIAGHFMSLVCPEKQDMVIGLPVHPSNADIDAGLTPSENTTLVYYLIEEHDLFVSLMPSE